MASSRRWTSTPWKQAESLAVCIRCRHPSPARRTFFGVVLLYVASFPCTAIAPALEVHYVAAYIFHFMVTVRLSEDGTVYCGALANSGGGTYTPSKDQMTTGNLLDGHGQSAVQANQFTQVPVSGVSPSATYDVYCYGVGANLNEMSLADIAASVQSMVATASGGDYTPPTMSYYWPYEHVDSIEAQVYVQMSEDGTVYCVALQDSGLGTTAPSGAQIRGGEGQYDSWASATILAQNGYKMFVRLEGLVEDTQYDIYCFGEDVSGNGIDQTPAYPEERQYVAATKRSVRMLDTFVATRLFLSHQSGKVRYHAEPAVWNLELPRTWGAGPTQRRNLESWSAPLALKGAALVDHTADVALGCEYMPAVPLGQPHIALVRRGRCPFSQKAAAAGLAGFQGVVVLDHPHGVFPDMAVPPGAGAGGPPLDTPAWMVNHATGAILAAAVASNAPGLLTMDVTDARRKPRLGDGQSDSFGPRRYAAG